MEMWKGINREKLMLEVQAARKICVFCNWCLSLTTGITFRVSLWGTGGWRALSVREKWEAVVASSAGDMQAPIVGDTGGGHVDGVGGGCGVGDSACKSLAREMHLRGSENQELALMFWLMWLS